jgi:hypothetical protein
MNEAMYYASKYGYPIVLAFFVIGSAVIANKDREKLSVGVLAGFFLLFIGHCLQNYGPQEVVYTQDHARITFTWLFSVGSFSSGLGLFMASVCYLTKSIKHASKIQPELNKLD